ncbi:hypothetical protein CF319_g6219 [Tilletia indica]|nr:hypothetical protein CF319_g6219 [Tilletia indica]
MSNTLPYILPAVELSSSLFPDETLPSAAEPATPTHRDRTRLPEPDTMERNTERPAEHTCFLTPLTINIAAQASAGTALAHAALYLGPEHPRNTLISTDLRSSTSLPAEAVHRPIPTPTLYSVFTTSAASAAAAAAQARSTADFQTLAALQGLLEAIRFVREKYARSSLCVHLRSDNDIAVRAWNDWIPRWEGTGRISGKDTYSSRGWPQLPGRPDTASSTSTSNSSSSSPFTSAQGLVIAYGHSAASSDEITDTASMFTALSTYSLKSAERNHPDELRRNPFHNLDPSSAPHINGPSSLSTTSPLVSKQKEMNEATPIPMGPPPIPRHISAPTYSAAYSLLRALAVLHRLFAHGDDDAFTPGQRNGRMRLTVSRSSPGKSNAAMEYLEASLRATQMRVSSATPPASHDIQRRNSSTIHSLPVTGNGKQQEAEDRQRQQRAREVPAEATNQVQRQSGRLHSVPGLFWKRRPSTANIETVDGVFERSQQLGVEGLADGVDLTRRGSRAKALFFRRSSLSSSNLLSGENGTGPTSSTPSTPLLTPPSTLPASPNVAILPSQSAMNSQAATPNSDADMIDGRFAGPLTPGLGSIKRKPVPDMLPKPAFQFPANTLAKPKAATRRSSGVLGLDLDLDLPGVSLEWSTLGLGVSTSQNRGNAIGSEESAGDLLPSLAAVLRGRGDTPLGARNSAESNSRTISSPHRRTTSVTIDSLTERATSPRKRAQTVTPTTLTPADVGAATAQVEQVEQNSIAFPQSENEVLEVRAESPKKPAWRWADPKHGETSRLATAAASLAFDPSESSKTSTPASNPWPAWKWAVPQAPPGHSSTAATPGHHSVQTHTAAPSVSASASQPASRNSPANTRPPSISEAAHRARWTEPRSDQSRAASPSAAFVIDAQRHQTPSPLLQHHTRTSSIISGGSGAGNGNAQATGAMASSGRSGLTGVWKWSNDSQTRLERQKARAEELAELAASKQGGGGGGGEHHSGGLSGVGSGPTPQQTSMGGSRRSSGASGNLPPSSLFSSSPYGSAGPGTLTALTLSAAGSSNHIAPPSPGKPPALNLQDALSLQQSITAAPRYTMRQQRSVPKLSDVPDAEHSVVGHAAAKTATGSAPAAESQAARAVRAEFRHDDELVDEHGSPVTVADLALSRERHLATAAWTASIAPLVTQQRGNSAHEAEFSGGNRGRHHGGGGVVTDQRSKTRAVVPTATAVKEDSPATGTSTRVAKAGTRSRILMSLQRPTIPSAETSTALGSKLAVRTGEFR